MIGENSHALIGGLQAAQQIFEVSMFEILGLLENMGSFEYLPLFHFYSVPIEVSTDEDEDFQGRVSYFKDNIGENVLVA